MPTTTIRGVELVRVGTWAASTGVVTITPEDLDAVLLAAQDPEVDRAAIRIGHVDARFDGEPALGWVENLRRVGDRLVGDLVDVPVRLAEVMPKAFRRRSVELGQGVRTPSGKLYRAALTGLALLGVQPPAVKGLADVLALYDTGTRVAAAGAAVEVEGSAVVELILGEVTDGQLGAIRATSAALAAAVEAGATTEADANAILDTVYATAGVPDATITDAAPPAGHNGDRDPHHPAGGTTMPVDEARIRELLSIEQDADVEAELRRIIAQAQANGESGNGSGNGEGSGTNGESGNGSGEGANGESDGSGEGANGEQANGRELVGAGAGAGAPGTVALSAGAYAELQAQAQAGATALARIEAQERADVIATAQREGRISPAEATANFAAGGAWAPLMERPPAELATFLSGLAPRFATVELGAASSTGDPADDPALDTFLADTFGISTGGI